MEVLPRVLTPILNVESIDMNPQNWFNKFSIPSGFESAIAIFKDAVSSLKVVGFSVAFAATTIYLVGYLISGTPQKRAEYKSKVMTLYILVMVLFGGLGLVDLLYDIAVMIGSS